MRRRTTTAVLGSLVLLTATGCGAADMTKQASPFANAGGTKSVTLSVQSWVGAQANVAVAQYLLQHELGYHVDTVQVDEVPAWDALSQGRVDAILEDWGHPDQEKRYVEDKKTIRRAGWPRGDRTHRLVRPRLPRQTAPGHHGLEEPRQVRLPLPHRGERRQGPADGRLPVVRHQRQGAGEEPQAGLPGRLRRISEAAQITQIKQFAKEKKPFLTYWYAPQWLFEKVPMTEVKLPPYKEGCDADAAKVACAYPHTPLQKYLNAGFARSGGKAAAFLKKFRWTTEDQNEVSLMIADQKLSPQDAAKKWVDSHPSVWRKWLP